MCYATPAEPKIVIDDKIIQRYSHSTNLCEDIIVHYTHTT